MVTLPRLRPKIVKLLIRLLGTSSADPIRAADLEGGWWVRSRLVDLEVRGVIASCRAGDEGHSRLYWMTDEGERLFVEALKDLIH